eukprot:2422403-Alexandrium_andersonii.AAC.1
MLKCASRSALGGAPPDTAAPHGQVAPFAPTASFVAPASSSCLAAAFPHALGPSLCASRAPTATSSSSDGDFAVYTPGGRGKHDGNGPAPRGRADGSDGLALRGDGAVHASARNKRVRAPALSPGRDQCRLSEGRRRIQRCHGDCQLGAPRSPAALLVDGTPLAMAAVVAKGVRPVSLGASGTGGARVGRRRLLLGPPGGAVRAYAPRRC